MRLEGSCLLLSPTDLVTFQFCRHASWLDWRWAVEGEASGLIPGKDDEGAELVQAKGLEHERSYLGQLERKFVEEVVTIPSRQRFAIARHQTLEAMRAGAKVIYQGAVGAGRWAGYADFLERVERPSGLGGWSYEPVDTKLKRSFDAKHALQLAVYAHAVNAMQGSAPERAYVVLGTGERASFRLDEVAFFVRRGMGRLEQFAEAPEPIEPEPCAACALCRWEETCSRGWDQAEHLALVAGVTSVQRNRLRAAGVATMTALAEAQCVPPGMAPKTFAKLKEQAALQVARRRGGPPTAVLRAIEPGRGFNRLPEPHPEDLFFDMEGDPMQEGGLEYLFGLHHAAREGRDFTSWWAHDRVAEREATAEVIGHLHAHWRRHPESFIYHYNHYEVTALRRLAMQHAVAEEMLDDLLHNERFVDLYRVVQQGLICSEPGYSLKDLEAFHQEKREGEVKTAAASIVAYERWRETGEQAILDEIEAYNAVDCRSTRGLRDWLLTLRPAEANWFAPEPKETKDPAAEDAATQALRAQLMAAAPTIGEERAELLFQLTQFHRRAAKPEWWAYFDKQDNDPDEMIDDLDCLGGLEAVGPPEGKGGRFRRYRFPQQETKLRAESNATVANLGASATIVELDRREGMGLLRFPVSKKRPPIDPPDRLDLTPGGPIKTEVIETALREVLIRLAEQPDEKSASADLFARNPPNLKGRDRGSAIVRGDDLVAEVTQAVLALDRSCLPIQGPPGTGKTYVSSHAILGLVRQGKRVAVMSNAHKAIDNLLGAVATRAEEAGERIAILKKGGDPPDDPDITWTDRNNEDEIGAAQVVGGTAWLFARPELAGSFDHLFIDEAGQVSLANALAASRAAQNLVLVGDPMQLAQPVQGVHPFGSGASCLEHLLGGERVIVPHMGAFLGVSRRMHPSVCGLISDLAYEGKLHSDKATASQSIAGLDPRLSLPAAGVRFVPVAHEGNAQVSEQEAEQIKAMYEGLLSARFTDRNGRARPMTPDDILVVAPYNAQVNHIANLLPPGARVGTVDRFQGQEAPACLISLATSSGEELPRDIGFLFSVNRLNVAISRAQALAVVVASPNLLDTACSTLEQMKLVNGLCRIAAYGSGEV